MTRLGVLSIAAMLVVACGRSDGPDAPGAAPPGADGAAVPVTTNSDEARAHYEAGQELFDELKFTEAHAAFVQAVDADPDFAMGHSMVATTALSAAEFFDEVAKAEALKDQVSEGERLIIEAQAAGAQNDQATQLAKLKALVKAYPKDERTHSRLGIFLFGQQDFTEAAKHFGHSTQINPDFAPAYNMLGYANRQLGKLDEAKAAFERYIELIPDEPNPHDSYAELLMETGDYDGAIEHYRMALEKDEYFGSAYAGASTAHALKGDIDDALVAAEQMLAAARTFNERQAALLQTTRVHLVAGNLDAAMAAAKKRLAEAEVKGDHAVIGDIHEYMGDMTLDAGDGAGAETHYDAALEHRLLADINDANKAAARRAHVFKTAICAMVDGKNELATERTAEYVAAASEHGTAFEKRRIHELQGFLAMLNEDTAGTAEHLAQASQTNPVVLFWAAMAHRDLGNLERAKELADQAANRNTLSNLLPLVRSEAQDLLDELAAA